MTTPPVEIDSAIVEVALEAAYDAELRGKKVGQMILASLCAAAPLLVKGEREACAKIAEGFPSITVSVQIAAAIREREAKPSISPKGERGKAS